MGCKDEGDAMGCLVVVAIFAVLWVLSRLGDIAYQLERIAASLAVLAGKRSGCPEETNGLRHTHLR